MSTTEFNTNLAADLRSDILSIASQIKTDWKELVLKYLPKYSDEINKKINTDLNDFKIYPHSSLIFNAFNHFNISDLKVVILGMDPYINPGEAMGLSFSVPEGNKIPPSLRNIFKELKRTYGERKSTDLTDWVKQGVLLLNTSLTVREGQSGSHLKIWEKFTADIINYLGNNCDGVVYLLWGNNAKTNGNYINKGKNLVLEHTHPSPLSRRLFEGNDHFIYCNAYLKTIGKDEIDWI